MNKQILFVKIVTVILATALIMTAYRFLTPTLLFTITIITLLIATYAYFLKKILKTTLIATSVLLVFLAIVLTTHIDFNEEWSVCEIDEDCVLIDRPSGCCGFSCGEHSINTKYERAYNTHKIIKNMAPPCLCSRCLFDLMERAAKPYCNEENKCSIKFAEKRIQENKTENSS